MRNIAVITTSRADYGIYLPILRLIDQREDLTLHLIVSGMHLSPEFGLTVEAIEADGFHIAERIEMLMASDTSEGVAKSMGVGLLGFGQLFARFRPDILLVLGDRFEMHAAVLAALPFKIPVAHLHGGELTQGAIDDALRHSITKLSHLHFVSTEAYAKRVIQLGESPWRITISGAPSLDNLKTVELLSREKFYKTFDLPFENDFLLVTFHPVSLAFEQTEIYTSALLDALDESGFPILFTMANADMGGHLINRLVEAFVTTRPQAVCVKNLGLKGYFTAMSLALGMVGNSSSGIIEAATFGLPVVNIGDRQLGRVQGKNVINSAHDKNSVLQAIWQVTSADFRQEIAGMQNPYGDGQAAERIIERLATVPLDEHLIVKKFYDL